MNKKILVISILTVFMLLAIAFTSTVTSNTQKPPKKESPLFRIRTRLAIREKIGDMIRGFVGERVFFLPFQWSIGNFPLYDDPTWNKGEKTCLTIGCGCVILVTLIFSCRIFGCATYHPDCPDYY